MTGRAQECFIWTHLVHNQFLRILFCDIAIPSRFGLFSFFLGLQEDNVLGRLVIIKEQKEGGNPLEDVVNWQTLNYAKQA